MIASRAITNDQDIIDSRDVIDRIDYLEGSEDEEDIEELEALNKLAEQASGSADWTYGETLIRDSHFRDYAEQLAEDLDLIKINTSWPRTSIDWEQAAEELQIDYTNVDFDGVEYWIRA